MIGRVNARARSELSCPSNPPESIGSVQADPLARPADPAMIGRGKRSHTFPALVGTRDARNVGPPDNLIPKPGPTTGAQPEGLTRR